MNVTGLADYLATYDPTAQALGFPEAPQYEARQARLMSWLRARYDAAVGEILAAVPGAEDVVK